MTYEMNKQLATTLNSLQPQLMNLPEFIPGDVLSWRKRGNALYELFQETMPAIGDMAYEDLWVPYGENSLKARWYCGSEVSSRGVVLFIHGGGGVAGSVDFYDPIVASYVRSSGVSFLSIEYGLAPEIDGYTQTKQAFSTLKWLRENSERFGIDPERIVLMGDSGGGGIAASAALMARDNLVPFAGLVLIYPMLDDRVDETEKAITPYLSISAAEIVTLWHARMPQGTDDALRAYISPARAGNLAGLPPVFIDVGELDLFCREAHEWSLKLVTDEVPVEFHSYPGVNHGFDLLAPESDIATQAMQLRSAAIRRMVVSAINS